MSFTFGIKLIGGIMKILGIATVKRTENCEPLGLPWHKHYVIDETTTITEILDWADGYDILINRDISGNKEV